MIHTGRALVAGALLVGLVTGGQAQAAEQSSAAPSTAKIVNGVPTNLQPTTGALLFVGPDTKNQFLDCSGVLIGCRTFLTAAHCLCTLSNNATACEKNELAAIDTADLRVFFQHAGIFHVRELYVNPDYQRGTRSDLMLVRLSERVDGIEPARFNDTHGVPIPIERGTAGIIAGFGNSGDDKLDAAIKRVGKVETAACPLGTPEPGNICWNFVEPVAYPGHDSNICFLDDGGPLFIDFGSGPEVAGIHAGGRNTCDANASAFDTAVYKNREWIRGVGGKDVGRDQCSDLGEIGENFVTVQGDDGVLPRSEDEARYKFDIPADTQLLRVTVNGDTEKAGDYDLFVKLDGPPTKIDYDCQSRGVGQFGVCELKVPDADNVQVLVRHVHQGQGRGKSRFQVTVTAFEPRPPDGNPPKTPEHLRYKKRSNDLRRLEWKDVSKDEDGFELQRSLGDPGGNFSTRVILKPDRTFYVDTAKPANIFSYRIRSFNEHGVSDWSNVCIVNRPAPLSPTLLKLADVTAHKAFLKWKDRSNDESAFEIQRRLQGDTDWQTIAVNDADDNTYTDSGLASVENYEYRVRSRGRLGNCVPNSRFSGTLPVTTLGE